MEHEDVKTLFEMYQAACGRTLFSIDKTREKITKQKRVDLDSAKSNISREFFSKKENLQKHYNDISKSLIKSSIRETVASHKILDAAEYMQIGSVRDLQSNKDLSVPYIIPFLGHSNLVLFDNQAQIDLTAKNIAFQILAQTAPGQIEIVAYNPDLRSCFSCFSGIEQVKLLSTNDELKRSLDNLSRNIVFTDRLLKGKYKSLLELRSDAQQPIGQLRTYIITGTIWQKDEVLTSSLFRLANNANRAGCSFVFVLDESIFTEKCIPLTNLTRLRYDIGSACWKSTMIPQLDIQITKTADEKIEKFVSNYIVEVDRTSAVSIPFDSIENTKLFWTDSTSDGITFCLGKMGLETVTLKLGNKVSNLHNVLITGATGKGKSNLLEVIIHSMCSRYSPDELELYLLDFKDGLTFKPYAYSSRLSWLPHAEVLGLESARDFGVAVLEYIESERKRRAWKLNQVNASSISIYRKKHPEVKLPRIVLLVDEYQKLFEIDDLYGKRAAELLENILNQGQSFGIHTILASQTVFHGATFTSKDDHIYSAIPVRIGLQNNLQESYATFSQGNDAAAKLRVRGEAILNVNYGAIDSNQKFTVAYAEPNRMEELRKLWCRKCDAYNHIPVVFGRNDEFILKDFTSMIKKWRNNVIELDAPQMLPCGQLISVGKETVAVKISNDSGRNVAILGSGDGQDHEPNTLPPNYAIGLIENMATALALQHPNGDARFYLIDGLDSAVYKKNGVGIWINLMERFGFPIEKISIASAPSFFVNLASQIKSHNCHKEKSYIFAIGLDRCASMSDPIGNNPFEQITGSCAFQEVLRIGPTKGFHTIAWWSNIAMYREHIGFNGDGYIDTKILLRVDDAAAKSILGPFVQWTGDTHRALIHDSSELQADLTVIPMSPYAVKDIGTIEAVIWE